MVYNNDILVMGGVGGSRKVERYMPSSNTWSELPSLPVAMNRGQAGTVGDIVWAVDDVSSDIYTTNNMVTWNKTVVSGFTSGWRDIFPAPLVTPDIINC